MHHLMTPYRKFFPAAAGRLAKLRTRNPFIVRARWIIPGIRYRFFSHSPYNKDKVFAAIRFFSLPKIEIDPQDDHSKPPLEPKSYAYNFEK